MYIKNSCVDPRSFRRKPMSRRDFVKLVGCAGTLSSSIIPASGLIPEQPYDGTFCSAPAAAFDPVMGYRWLPGPTRVIRVTHSNLVFDNTFGGNNYGSHCQYNFTPKKPSPRTFRFVVLGDSYTAGIYMPITWPEVLQQLLRSRTEWRRDVQVYPFPIDGGGLLNWHSEFMHEILPEFEFDGLIIASWYENLARDWMVFHGGQTGLYLKTFGYDERPKSREEFEKIRPTMGKFGEARDNREIQQIVDQVRQLRPPPVPKAQCPKELCCHSDNNLYCEPWTRESEPAPADYAFSEDAFIKRYSTRRLSLLSEMINACRERHAPVIFCAVPTRQGVLRVKKTGCVLLHRAESEGLCRHFGLNYFDGYAIFDGIDAEAVHSLYWLKYDTHWGFAASQLFALKLAEFITRKGIV